MIKIIRLDQTPLRHIHKNIIVCCKLWRKMNKRICNIDYTIKWFAFNVPDDNGLTKQKNSILRI